MKISPLITSIKFIYYCYRPNKEKDKLSSALNKINTLELKISKLASFFKMADEMENGGFASVMEYIISIVNTKMNGYNDEIQK